VYVRVFVALVNRHAKRMCRIMWPLWHYDIFPHYFINSTIFRNKDTEHKKRVLIFSTTMSEIFLFLRRTDEDIIMHLYRCSRKVPVIRVSYYKTWNFLDIFSEKKTQISNFMKIRPVGSELSHADGRTYRQIWRT